MHLKRCLCLLLVLASLIGAVPASAAYDRPYYIEVDLTNQIVTVFNSSDGSVARQMLCSAGIGDKTPTGTWYMPTKDRDDERTEWYYMPSQYVWVKYATKIYYAYFFHSIPYNKKSDDAMSKEGIEDFGYPASHGCIRLRVEDAEFLAKECLSGTRVEIYRSGEKDEELRQLLFVSSYTGEDGMTYSEFLGISEDDLGRGSTGSEVMDLQHRLNDLGYYDGAYDGVYSNEMVGVVKQLQKDLGLSQTGISTKELLEVIYSEDAPVSTGQIDVTDGQSGPVVESLQSALSQLGIYKGPIDSVYDVEVSDAVKTFQQICGYPADGVATAETQHAIYYVLNQVKEAMGGEEFTIEYANEELTTGTINSPKANILVRSKPSTDSASIGKVVHGDVVTVLATQDGWAQIICDAGVGYIYTKYLSDKGSTYNYIANFVSPSGATYTLGTTMEERLAGGGSLKEEVEDYYSSEEFLAYLDDADVTYASVNTGSENVKLNLRAEASSEADILEQISNGVSMRVMEKGDEWTKVVFNGSLGYLMTQYLTFWQGTAEDEADVIASQQNPVDMPANEAVTAIVTTDGENTRANIYATPSLDASILARAPAQLELTVLNMNRETGWALIDYNGNQGYMLIENLYLNLEVGA